jgi:putative copper resistance protein D
MSIFPFLGATEALAAHVHPEPDGEVLSIFWFLLGARWLSFAAAFVLFGSAFFWFYIGRERLLHGLTGLPRTRRATTHLLRLAAPVAAVSGAAWLAGILANMTSGFGNLTDLENWRLFFFETPFGPVSILRLVVLAIALVLSVRPRDERAWYAAMMLIGAVLLVTQAWLGHAAEGGAGLYGMLMIVAYGIHALAAAAWVGGLPPLLLALAEQSRTAAETARKEALDILSRYSLMAMTAVTAIVASGILNAGFRTAGSLDKLFLTPYGDTLFLKVTIVVSMLCLAGFNRFVAMPRLRAASTAGTAPIVWLGRSVTFELILGILVLGVAAALGLTPPPQ